VRRELAVHFNVTVLPISTISIFGSDISIKISGCGSGTGLLFGGVVVLLSLSIIQNSSIIINFFYIF